MDKAKIIKEIVLTENIGEIIDFADEGQLVFTTHPLRLAVLLDEKNEVFVQVGIDVEFPNAPRYSSNIYFALSGLNAAAERLRE
jgi:hypothetical protein